MTEREKREKEDFVSQLQNVLLTDDRNSLDSLHYAANAENCDEIIHITYRGGYAKTILVTGNSIGQIAKEIIAEVYE